MKKKCMKFPQNFPYRLFLFFHSRRHLRNCPVDEGRIRIIRNFIAPINRQWFAGVQRSGTKRQLAHLDDFRKISHTSLSLSPLPNTHNGNFTGKSKASPLLRLEAADQRATLYLQYVPILVTFNWGFSKKFTIYQIFPSPRLSMELLSWRIHHRPRQHFNAQQGCPSS